MKKILIPVDFSVECEYALKAGASIAKKTSCEIILLHLLDLPEGVVDPTNYGNTNNSPTTLLYMKRAQEKFEALVNESYFDGINITKSVLFQNTHEGILEESSKQDIDLIIMGSKGSEGFSEILVGSNTEKVVRSSDIPVLVIKNEVEDFKVENIVFTSDFKLKNKLNFPKVVDFAKIFGAQIHLLKVVTASEFESTSKTKQRFKKFRKGFEDVDVKEHIYNDRSIERGILRFSEKKKMDIIILNTTGWRGVRQFFNGSISKGVSNHASLPVMTIRRPDTIKNE